MSGNTAMLYTSQFIEAYDDVQILHQKWRQQRQETILKIRSISHDIQNLETMHKKGHLAYSSVGIVAGVMTIAGIVGAPFTFGGSLSLTAVGAATGIVSGAAGITHSWLNSSKIKSKCDEATKLLEESQDLTVRLLDELKNLHMIQTKLCIVLNISQISFRTLGSIASVGGEALVALLARNIPNIEKSSKALSFMFGVGGINFGFKFSAEHAGKVVAPVVGKQVASGIAKTSLRVIGTAAIGVGILMDVLSIVDNKKALDGKKLSDQAIALEDAANEMENEMKSLDKLFATPSSEEKELIPILASPMK